MTANPLMTARSPAYGGIENLELHVARLNALNWVRDSGRLYFVARRESADGTDTHFVDRKA